MVYLKRFLEVSPCGHSVNFHQRRKLSHSMTPLLHPIFFPLYIPAGHRQRCGLKVTDRLLLSPGQSMCCTSATLPFILSALDTPLRWGRMHPSTHHHPYGASPEEPPLFMDDSQQNLMMTMGPQWGRRRAEKWVRCWLASLRLNQRPKTSQTRSWSLQKHHSCVSQWRQTDRWVQKDEKTKR